MNSKNLLHITPLITLLLACTSPSSNSQLAQTARQTQASVNHQQESPAQIAFQVHAKESTMQEKTLSGAIPDNLDIRVQRRDGTPLPPEALIRFQLINRGKSPHLNYRWELYEDGRLFLARHSGDTSGDYRIPFDTELPSVPTKKLSADLVNELKEHLKQANFMDQSPYQIDNTVQDGGFYIVTARLDGKVHEVIYEAASPPLVEFLKTIQSL